MPAAQIGDDVITQSSKAQIVNGEFVQLPTAQLVDNDCDCAVFPLFLSLTTFTNHVEILNHVNSIEERVFYVLYAARERLNQMELRRAFAAQTYDMIMSREKKMSASGITDGTMDGTMALRIVSAIEKDPSVTMDQLSEKLGIARRSLVRYMNILQDNKRIRRVVGKRFGHWEVLA